MSSSSSTTSKLEKEKLKLVQEKCQTLLNEMLRDEDNKYCVDCDAKGPRWASWNLGIFLCIRCAGIHRNLGVHISRVKSVNLDTWTPEQVVTMQQMGNSRARAVYEANMPDNFRRPQTDVALESFIRAKYEHKKYIAQEWVQPSIPKVNWDAEIEESLRKKKDAKKSVNSDGINLAGSAIPKPKPASNNTASNSKPQNPPPISSAQAAAVSATVNNASTESSEKPSNPSDDLLGLMTSDSTSNSTSLDPFASPVKTVSASGGGDMNDLGGLFATPDGPNDANAKKMTKESILSLYGQSNQFPGNNIFANNQTGAPAPTGNPFPQFNSQFNPNLVPGAQGGMNLFMNPGMVSTGSTPMVKDPGMNNVFNFQPDIGQLQQQIHGMNLSFGSPMQPPANPAAPLLGNFNQGSFGLSGLMGSTVTPNTGAMPSQVSQSRNAGPFF